MTKTKAIALLSLSAALLLAACNTVKGVGRDIQSVGSAGERVMKD